MRRRPVADEHSHLAARCVLQTEFSRSLHTHVVSARRAAVQPGASG
jgi:hypothetical protein